MWGLTPDFSGSRRLSAGRKCWTKPLRGASAGCASRTMHLAPSFTNQRAVGAIADERIRVRIAHPTPAPVVLSLIVKPIPHSRRQMVRPRISIYWLINLMARERAIDMNVDFVFEFIKLFANRLVLRN